MNNADEVTRPENSGQSNDALIEQHMGLVYGLAKRFEGRGVERDELAQSGFVGLAAAANGFDASKGVAFSSYAFKFVENAMRECVRKSRLIPLPRNVYSGAMELRAVLNTVDGSFGETTRLRIAAMKLGMDEADISKQLFEIELCTNILSIDRSFCDEKDSESYASALAADYGFEERSVKSAYIANAIAKLKSIEKAIVRLRFFEEKTQSQTAKMLEISQPAVSRIEKAALVKLRGFIEN